jgi:hypothetical protein
MSLIHTSRASDELLRPNYTPPPPQLANELPCGTAIQMLLGPVGRALLLRLGACDPDIGLRSLHIITVLTKLARRQLTTLCVYL